MLVTEGYYINLQEWNQLQEVVAAQLYQGGEIDQRFAGIQMYMSMLVEQNNRLVEQNRQLKIEVERVVEDNHRLNVDMAVLSEFVRDIRESTVRLTERVGGTKTEIRALSERHENLVRQVESNVVALHQKIDELALDFGKLKI